MQSSPSRRALLRMVATVPAAVLVAACGAMAPPTPTAAPAAGAQVKPTAAAPAATPPAAGASPGAAGTAPAGAAAGGATTSAAPGATAAAGGATAPGASGATAPGATKPAAAGAAAGPATKPATSAGVPADTGNTPVPSASTPAAAGGTPAAAAAEAASSGCMLTPQQTEGPYYIDTKLVRSDITEGKPGTALKLELSVQNLACQPLPDATVEIWHCDALGEYSGFSAAAMQAKPESGYGTPLASAATQVAKPGPPPGGTPGAKPGGPPPGGAGGPAARQTPTNQLVFLRGGQVAGADGKVTFQTVYPGWYQGRTPHIHVKVHAGGSEVHTGQLYFDELITKQVYAQAPYAGKGTPDTTNDSDSIYRDGGDRSQLALTKVGEGYTAALTLIVQR
jgi:protocatechuate 3,4-dioxygenase beta subunit